MFTGADVSNEKRFWLSAALFLAHYIVNKRMSTQHMDEAITWTDRFLEKYSASHL